MSMIGPVQSRLSRGSPVGKINLRWKGFVEKVIIIIIIFFNNKLTSATITDAYVKASVDV